MRKSIYTFRYEGICKVKKGGDGVKIEKGDSVNGNSHLAQDSLRFTDLKFS